MCLLSIQQAVPFTWDEMKAISGIHRDGYGFGYFDPVKKSLMVLRSMKMDENFYHNYLVAIETGAQVVLHFRMGTLGQKAERNCHPFYLTDVNGDPMLLFHNGIVNHRDLEGWAGKRDLDDSDTAILAKALNGRLSGVDDPLVPIILDLVGSTSRFVLMDNSGGLSYFGDGWEQAENGYHSNCTYKGSYATRTVYRGSATAVPYGYNEDGEYGGWGEGRYGGTYHSATNTATQQKLLADAADAKKEPISDADAEMASILADVDAPFGPCAVCGEANGREGIWYGHSCSLCYECRVQLRDDPSFLDEAMATAGFDEEDEEGVEEIVVGSDPIVVKAHFE